MARNKPNNIPDIPDIVEAVKDGNIGVVEQLIKAGIDINKVVVHASMSLLHVAIEYGQLEVAKLLIDSGADINRKDMNGWTPLFLASASGYLELVNMLLNRPDIQPNISDNSGKTPLYMALEEGLNDVALRLLEVPGIDVNKLSYHKYSPLHMAIIHGNMEVIRKLLENPTIDAKVRSFDGKTPSDVAQRIGFMEAYREIDTFLTKKEINNPIDENGRTRLHVTAQKGLLGALKENITMGADVNKSDFNGITALMLAASAGHEKIVEFLLTVPGIDVNKAANDGTTALHMAVVNNNTNIVEKLLSRPGIDVNKIVDDGTNALYQAIARGYERIVELLLRAPDINVNIIVNRTTPLITAVYNNRKSIVEDLLARPDLDVNKTSLDGTNALHIAALNGRDDIIEMLLDNSGININALSAEGCTPLYYAALGGHIDIVERMLTLDGIDVEFHGQGHSKVIERIINRNYPEIYELLQLAKRAKLKWKGWSRSDISVLNSVLDTTVDPDTHKAPCESISLCPVCLKTIHRIDGCRYMSHNCSALPGFYHEELYNLYKDPANGLIRWCTICNRICKDVIYEGHPIHAHMQLDAAKTTHPDVVVTGFTNAFGGEAECIASGGGGRFEKLTRFNRLREYALRLNDEVGNISFQDAMEELVEEMWEAPLKQLRQNIRNVQKIKSEGKWKIPNTSFPLHTIPANESAPAPPAPYPYKDRANMAPILNGEGMNVISMNTTPVLIMLKHRQSDNTINVHDGISIQSLFTAIALNVGNPASDEFGSCTMFGRCTSLIYPNELQYILDNYPKDHLSDEKRVEYQSLIDKYKMRFNERYRDVPTFKERVNANIAAGRNMALGGAGAGAGRGGARRKTRKRKHKS